MVYDLNQYFNDILDTEDNPQLYTKETICNCGKVKNSVQRGTQGHPGVVSTLFYAFLHLPEPRKAARKRPQGDL